MQGPATSVTTAGESFGVGWLFGRGAERQRAENVREDAGQQAKQTVGQARHWWNLQRVAKRVRLVYTVWIRTAMDGISVGRTPGSGSTTEEISC